MAKSQFHLRTLLGIVAVFAITIPIFTRPSYFVASLLWTAAMLSLAVGSVGAILTKGESRAFWIGYSALGWFHMILALAPWFDDRTGEFIFTRQLLDRLGKFVDHLVADPGTMPGIWRNLPYAANGKSYQYLSYLVAGQSLFTVAIAVLGGIVARYMYRKTSNGATGAGDPAAAPK